MKALSATLFLIVSGAFFSWNLVEYITTPLPCEEPIIYTIGAFDQRFGLSQADFLSALAQAEAVWEKPAGLELFTYSAVETKKDTLPINLIYDYRQETTSTLVDIEHRVEVSEASYKTLQAKYASSKSQYEAEKVSYDALVRAFNAASSAYEQEVADWNDSPRTSKSQFQQLEQHKNDLQVQLSSLKTAESKLNQMVRDLNTLVDSLNRLATSLNLNVKAYNTIGATRGESFTGGMYYSADGKGGIDIFEFSSHAKLVRILAHELGHALGLDHIEDQKSIMYYLNDGNVSVASESDRAALKTLCRIK